MAKLVEFPTNLWKSIQKMQALAEHKTPYKTISHALALYVFCLRQTGLGKKLILRDEDGKEQEVVIE